MEKRNIIIVLVVVAIVGWIFFTFDNNETVTRSRYIISNPYKDVDWGEYGQYKADFHMHSTNSDGLNTVKAMVNAHYKSGYDIIAFSEHHKISEGWDKVKKGALTSKKKAEYEAGVGRNGRGMIGIPYAIEQSRHQHINTYFANYENKKGDSVTKTLNAIDKIGGIAHLNHVGRYTGAATSIARNEGDTEGIILSKSSHIVKTYVDLFSKHHSLIGMEVIRRLDTETAGDRVLWDSILTQTMPEGNMVLGFSNGDSHSTTAADYAWNVMLMPELTQSNVRNSMETGAFYIVSRVSRLEGVNRFLPNGKNMPLRNGEKTEYLKKQKTPSIQNIIVDEIAGTITIEGADYDIIEWVADGYVIHRGAILDLEAQDSKINSYVRAQLKSDTGIAFTQPFGIRVNAK